MFGLKLGNKQKTEVEVTPPQDKTALWGEIISSLKQDLGYKERMDSLFSRIDSWLGLEAYYLYRRNPGGERFFLDYMKVRTKEEVPERPTDEDEIAEAEMTGSDQLEDSQSILNSPILDFPYEARYDVGAMVTTPLGHLFSSPLHREGRTVGILRVGPFRDKRVPREVARLLEECAMPLGFAVTSAWAEEDLHEEVRTIRRQSEVSNRLLSSAFELYEFLDLLLSLTLTATDMEAGFIAIAPAGGDKFTIRVSDNLPEKFVEEVDLSTEEGKGLFDWLPESNIVVISDYEFVQRMGVKQMLAVPLVKGVKMYGVFVLANFVSNNPPVKHAIDLMETFANQITLVLENEQIMEAFTENYLNTLRTLNKSVDVRNPSTHTHTERVTLFAAEIARRMGFSEFELDMIEKAGLMHDVGMAGVAEVSKGFQADFNHPSIGSDMLRVLSIPSGIVEAIATHHEWFDGWGFPNNLKGNDIPLTGRVLAMAEFLTESTTIDELHEHILLDKLIEDMKVRQGTQFDPKVVETAMEMLEDLRRQLGDDDEFCMDMNISAGLKKVQGTYRWPKLCLRHREMADPSNMYSPDDSPERLVCVEWVDPS